MSDILVRGLDGHGDLDAIRELPRGEEYRLWKRGMAPGIGPGERVFFVSEGEVVGSCELVEIDRDDHGPDKSGAVHNGPAIVVQGPFHPQDPPVALPRELDGLGWGWRYVPRTLRGNLG